MLQPFYPHPGISGIRDWKWYLAAVLQCAALFFLLADPWFGRYGFRLEPNLLVPAIAVLIVASLAWEGLLFGPVRGVNLLLQVTFLAPFTLYLCRITEKSPAARTGGSLVETLSGWTHSALDLTGIARLVPALLRDIFSNPALLVILLLLLTGMCFRKTAIRLGVVGLILGGFTFTALFSAEGSNRCFIPAVIALAGAAVLQWHPCRRLMETRNILDALGSVAGRARFRAAFRIALAACRRGSLREAGVLAILREEFPQLSPDALRAAASRLLADLVEHRRILIFRADRNGVRLEPAAELTEVDSPLSGIAVVPRLIFVTLFAILWIISPLDLIPDAIPFFGALDDATVAILAFGQIYGRYFRRQ